MEWSLCGLVDLLLVLGAIISCVIGFKKGFINKVISLIGLLAVTLFAVFFAAQFSEFLCNHNIIYPSILAKFETVVSEKTAGATTAKEMVSALMHVNETIAGWLLNIAKIPAETTPAEVVDPIARLVMKIVAFGILFVLGIIVLITLKIVAKCVRNNMVIKVIDGVLGVVLYAALFALTVAGLFTLLYLLNDQWHVLPEAASKWIATDFGLDTPKTIKISGPIYLSNPFMWILGLFGVGA